MYVEDDYEREYRERRERREREQRERVAAASNEAGGNKDKPFEQSDKEKELEQLKVVA